MEAERWKQIEDLYQAALAQAPAKRAEFLRHACPDDAALRAEVESLLNQNADTFLESSPLPAMLSPGVKLGSFELIACIGRGGMGEVWRAHDARLKRDVAIKILPMAVVGEPDRIARFEHEARAASALSHPNIVPVFDIGHQDGKYWIVSELVDGESLRALISRGPLPPRKAVEIATQIAAGLAAAHAAGLVHRDLKPGNIMLHRDGRVRIVDFGLAKRVGAGLDSATLTDAGVVLGTAGYMAPEQVRGEAVDQRADLFSFGVVLYEMLSGKQAFTGASSVELMHAILKNDPPDLPAAVPPALDRIVRRCLEKEPARRFQSAADLGFAIESLSLSPARAERPKRRAWWKWATLLAACAITAALYWVAMRPPRLSAPSETTLRRLTNDRGLCTDAVISPDGKLVAYASDRANSSNLDIWVQQVDGGGLVRLTDDPADDYDPAFSPDATQVAFRSERAEPGIYVAPAIGGEARLVIPQGRRPRFSPDGQRLMYWTGAEPHDVRGSSDTRVWVRSIAGGETTQIGAGCRLFDRTPVWAPDGTRILFVGTCGSDITTRGSRPENYGLSGWVASIDGKDLKPNRELYNIWRTIHSLPVIDQWIANPSRLLIPLPVGDAASVMAVPLSADGTSSNGPPRTLAFAGGKATRLSAALDGRIALSSETGESHIWTLPIDGNGAASGTPKQLTDSPAGEFSPALSADGEKLAFLSIRANGTRLFYEDLASGRTKEVSTEGYRYDTPVFNHGATKIMCVQYPSSESWRNFVFEVPITGGMSRKVWDKAVFSWLWDWAPDDATLLSLGVLELDLESGESTQFLAGPENLGEAHFSNDGHWVVFLSSPKTEFAVKPLLCRVFIAPFRKALVPKREWIAVTDKNLDLYPHFSANDKLIFFVSERDGFPCVWAQRLKTDMHPDGPPLAVYHSHERRRRLDSLVVGPHAIVFGRTEMAGNIWLLEERKRDGQ